MNSRIMFSVALALCAAVPGTAAAAPAGALDPTFRGGAFSLDLRPGDEDFIQDQAVMADGRVVAVTVPGDVLRLRADGTLDATFSGDGVAPAPLGPGGEPTGVDVDAAGRVWIAGATVSGGDYQPAIGRLTAAGEPDPAFDDDGWMRATFADDGTYGWGSDVMPLPGGGAVLGGGHWIKNGGVDLGVLQVTDAGKLDSSFSEDGRLVGSAGVNDYPADAVRDAQGRISVIGTLANNDGLRSRVSVLRVSANGTPDAAFGGDGTIAANLPTTEYVGAQTLATDVTGRLLLGVSLDETPAVARLTLTGAADPTFDGDGMREVGPRFGSVGLDASPDGKVLVATSRMTSSTTSAAEVLRLDDGGRPDPAFGDGGRAAIAFSDAPGQVAGGVAVQPDGRILVTGYAYTPGKDDTGGENRGRPEEPTVDLGFARLLGTATADPAPPAPPAPPARVPAPAVPKAAPKTAAPRSAAVAPRIVVTSAKRFAGTAPVGAKVEVAVLRRSGKRCRALAATARARFRTVACSKPVWLRAKGSSKWTLTLAKRLPRGRYEVLVRVAGTKAPVRKAFRVR